MNRIDVLGLGAVAIDDLIRVEAYPPADAKVHVLDPLVRRFGEQTEAAAIAAATSARGGDPVRAASGTTRRRNMSPKLM